jgi:hypothetical protein
MIAIIIKKIDDYDEGNKFNLAKLIILEIFN